MDDILENALEIIIAIMGYIDKILTSIDAGCLLSALGIIVSLFVPIVVLIYQDQTDTSRKHFNEFGWDKMVLLKTVAHSKTILVSIIVMIIASLLWSVRNGILDSILIVVYIYCAKLLIQNLIRIYRWFMSDKIGEENAHQERQAMRIKFLEELEPNHALEIWNETFCNIEKENPFLGDYSAMFFDDFLRAEKEIQYGYQQCLTKNIERINCRDPKFQEKVWSFISDYYLNSDEQNGNLDYFKRQILQIITKEISYDKYISSYGISFLFDNALNNVNNKERIVELVYVYAEDILLALLSAEKEIPRRANYIGAFSLFPLAEWKIVQINNRKDIKCMKALGLFRGYLELMAKSTRNLRGDFELGRAKLIEQMCFGYDTEKLSMEIINIVCLFWGQELYSKNSNETHEHARIRTFIDDDYGLFFEKRCLSISGLSGDKTERSITYDEKLRIITDSERERDRKTIKILSCLYGEVFRSDDFRRIKAEIMAYDLKDKQYKYYHNETIIEDNLEKLKEVITKIEDLFLQR